MKESASVLMRAAGGSASPGNAISTKRRNSAFPTLSPLMRRKAASGGAGDRDGAGAAAAAAAEERKAAARAAAIRLQALPIDRRSVNSSCAQCR